MTYIGQSDPVKIAETIIVRFVQVTPTSDGESGVCSINFSDMDALPLEPLSDSCPLPTMDNASSLRGLPVYILKKSKKKYEITFRIKWSS